MIMKGHKRQAQGITKAKVEGRYRGHQPNLELHHDILDQLTLGRNYSDIQQKLGCSRLQSLKLLKVYSLAPLS